LCQLFGIKAKAHKLFGSSPHRAESSVHMNGTEVKGGGPDLELEDEGIHHEDEEDEVAYKGNRSVEAVLPMV